MTIQRYEIEEWLGDGHGLDDDQVAELMRAAEMIAARYPDEDDRDEREAALTVTYRLMVEQPDVVVADLAEVLAAARAAEVRALAGIRQAAVTLVRDGGRGVQSQAGFAAAAGVDRMAVRTWLGLRRT